MFLSKISVFPIVTTCDASNEISHRLISTTSLLRVELSFLRFASLTSVHSIFDSFFKLLGSLPVCSLCIKCILLGLCSLQSCFVTQQIVLLHIHEFLWAQLSSQQLKLDPLVLDQNSEGILELLHTFLLVNHNHFGYFLLNLDGDQARIFHLNVRQFSRLQRTLILERLLQLLHQLFHNVSATLR